MRRLQDVAIVIAIKSARVFDVLRLVCGILRCDVLQAHTVADRTRFEAIGDGSPGRFCTQQMLVNNLLKELIDNLTGDVRFDVADVQIQNDEGRHAQVAYSDASGSHELACDYIVGCDGSRGDSRSSIPDGVLTKYSHEFGYAWLAALVETPLTGHPIIGVSDTASSRSFLAVPAEAGSTCSAR